MSAVPPAPGVGRSGALGPLLSAAAAAALFVCMDVTIKALAARYGAVQLTYFRFASGSVFAVVLWLALRTPMPTRAQWRLHLARCALLLVSLTLYFHALTLLPLAQAVAMGYLAPIFISVLAVVVLREQPSRWIWLALALGGAGAAVSLWPELMAARAPAAVDHDAGSRLIGLASAAAAAVAFSGVMVLSRLQAQQDSLPTILLLQNLLPLAALTPVVGFGWQPVAMADLGPIVLVGALATGGLLALTWAFRHLEASRVAPFEYTGLVWAGSLGYLVFGEVPTVWTLASAALIVGGCLLLLRR